MASPVIVRVRADPTSLLTDRISDVATDLGCAVEHVKDVPRDEAGEESHAAVIGDVGVGEEAPRWLLEAAVLRALRPRHILFLCVANSARSQLAEGLARSLERRAGGWPDGTRARISSAGSQPTSVRPQAVAVLEEMGIDASGQRSTGVGDLARGPGAADPVDAVVTLCAEEVCPVWLGEARRLHWRLPDPAAAEGTPEEVLDAFRAVRDELRSRLGVLLLGRVL